MPYVSPYANLKPEILERALIQQKSDFEIAGIHSGYRGVRLLGYADGGYLNKFRRGEKLMSGVYVLRLSRLIQWKLLGFELDVIYSIDWIEEEIVWRQGKTSREFDSIGEKIDLIRRRKLPLDPFQIDRNRMRKQAYRLSWSDGEGVDETSYQGMTIPPDRVVGVVLAAKPGFSGFMPFHDVADLLKAKYPGCDADNSVLGHPLAAKVGGLTTGLNLAPPSAPSEPNDGGEGGQNQEILELDYAPDEVDSEADPTLAAAGFGLGDIRRVGGPNPRTWEARRLK